MRNLAPIDGVDYGTIGFVIVRAVRVVALVEPRDELDEIVSQFFGCHFNDSVLSNARRVNDEAALCKTVDFGIRSDMYALASSLAHLSRPKL